MQNMMYLFSRIHFSIKNHSNFIGQTSKGITVISILKDKEMTDETISDPVQAILRTSEGDSLITRNQCIAVSSKTRFHKLSSKDIIKNLIPDMKIIRKVEDQELDKDLIKFEESEAIMKYKFGVLYLKEGQTTENELFANDSPSKTFQTFLSLIGDKIKLHGFKGYVGGLDPTHGRTGEEAIHNKWNNFEIMYHVSCLLPNNISCAQRLERKRHIGNDIVVVIFLDSETTPFNPACMHSTMNHVFVVIRPIIQNDKTCYHIALACKEGISSFSPELPLPAIFDHGPAFRDFLITKLINAERAALHTAPAFSNRLSTARSMQLNEFNDKYQS